MDECRCGCEQYTGDGGECRTRFADHTAADFGTGPALVEWATARCVSGS